MKTLLPRRRTLEPALKNKVMAFLKVYHGREYQIHHVYGRDGRLAACRLFCCPLALEEHDEMGRLGPVIIKVLRRSYRSLYLRMQEGNDQNRDQNTCWWRSCPHIGTCPLYVDANLMRQGRIRDDEGADQGVSGQ